MIRDEILSVEDLQRVLADGMDESTLLRRVRNTISSLIDKAYGETCYLSIKEYSDKQEALEVLEEVILAIKNEEKQNMMEE